MALATALKSIEKEAIQQTQTIIKEPNILPTEVEQAVKRAPRYKATGAEELPPIVAQAAGEAKNEWLPRIFRAAWEKEKVPSNY